VIPALALALGINYFWYQTHAVPLSECRTTQDARTAGTWILPHYGDPQVRATVRSQLRAMHASGFTSVRFPVFYDHSEDETADDGFTSTDGAMRTADRAKLAAFVGDAASAGFRTIEAVASFQEENDLYCKRKEWGDCFRAERTGENWRFIAAVTRTVREAAGTATVRIDLGNELAPDPHMPPKAKAKAAAYLGTIAGNFQREFGDGWLVSAARSDLSDSSETRARIELLLADLRAAGLTPKYLETHNYTADGNDLAQSMDAMESISASIGARFVLGELRYHSGVQASAIAGWVRRHPRSHLSDVIQWPEYAPGTVCATDPSPPYTTGPLGKLLDNE
jgi:hypothetical protein